MRLRMKWHWKLMLVVCKLEAPIQLWHAPSKAEGARIISIVGLSAWVVVCGSGTGLINGGFCSHRRTKSVQSAQKTGSGKTSVPEDWFWKFFRPTEKTDFTDKLLVLDWRLTWETVQSQKTRRDLENCPVSQSQKTDLGNCSVPEVWLWKLGSFAKADWLGKRSRPGQPVEDRDLGNCSVSPRRLRWETAVQSQKTEVGNRCSVPEDWLRKLFSPSRLTWGNCSVPEDWLGENV